MKVISKNGKKYLSITKSEWSQLSLKFEEAKKKKSKKKWNEGTPYAICTKSIGKTEGTQERSEWSADAEERYERCKKHVKKQHDKK